MDGQQAQPDDIRMGAVLPVRAGQPRLCGGRCTRDEAAATVALSEAQGQERKVRALSGRSTVGTLWPYLPCAEDQGLSVGEGMISSESRMPEIGMSGLMSGGE